MQLHFVRWITTNAVSDDSIREAENCVVLEQDGGLVAAFVKRIPQREMTVEIVCAVLGGLLGLPIPDPALVQMPDGEIRFGSMAEKAPSFRHLLAADAAAFERLKAWPQLAAGACFDEWIVNTDRHAGNVLYDGLKSFWLIDHGKALEPPCEPDTLRSPNRLFEVAREGCDATEISIRLRPTMLGVMQNYADSNHDLVRKFVDGVVLDQLSEVLELLARRQPHLLGFVAQRLPQPQRDMFDGKSG